MSERWRDSPVTSVRGGMGGTRLSDTVNIGVVGRSWSGREHGGFAFVSESFEVAGETDDRLAPVQLGPVGGFVVDLPVQAGGGELGASAEGEDVVAEVGDGLVSKALDEPGRVYAGCEDVDRRQRAIGDAPGGRNGGPLPPRDGCLDGGVPAGRDHRMRVH